MTFRKILCPVDFSEASATAARYASRVASQNKAELTLLHVAPAADFEFAIAGPNHERLAEFTEHRNRVVRQALGSFPGDPALQLVAKREVRQGEAATQIVCTAKADGYDLIVMPTHGAGAIRRWLLMGSVTTKVLHTAECPVIAATNFTESPTWFHRLLCAVDLGPASRRVLCTGARLARQMDASLAVVHAAQTLGADERDFVDQGWRVALKRRVRLTIDEMQRETSAAGELVVEAGEPHGVVPEVAERVGAGLIVIGRGVHTGVLGRLRAHAYEIIRNAPCPVLSV
jgi:nucleotide-binding universal stress UspA family protein